MHALSSLWLDEGTWDEVRQELKALVALDHPGVLAVHCWYEKRLPMAAVGAAPGYEVSVATELMVGGDLLQRAILFKYTEHDVRLVSRGLLDAVLALHTAGVQHIDLSPWSLLYSASPQGGTQARLHEGLVITNAGSGAPGGPRDGTPIRAAFDPPELFATPPGRRDACAAVWALGKLMRLLLCGTLECGVPIDAQDAEVLLSDRPSARNDVPLPPPAVVAMEALCAPSPSERPAAADALTLEWIAAEPTADGGAHLLEAQAALNRWYDAFLFEGMTARLTQMTAE